ncbi:MAG: PhzF family phenazine biosynthesis protein [Acidimicrobiales bacterium]
MALPISVVDAFTDAPFSGNPAGVVVLDGPAPDGWMQAVAAEVNLAETAFVTERADGDHDLRWFTPTVEVPLCGHATLATAHVLGGDRRFHTRSGILRCTANADGSITLDLPATRLAGSASPAGWGATLGLSTDPVVDVLEGSGWTLVELPTAADVAACAPDRQALLHAGGHAIVVADTSGDPSSPYDSVCRMFAPSAGIDEDPVTGAAHCILATWLADRTARTTFRCHQASARGGVLGVELAGDRARQNGRAVTVWRGELLATPPG